METTKHGRSQDKISNPLIHNFFFFPIGQQMLIAICFQTLFTLFNPCMHITSNTRWQHCFEMEEKRSRNNHKNKAEIIIKTKENEIN